MKKIRRLAALCAVLTLMLCFTTVAYATNGESGTEESADIVTGGISETEATTAFTPDGTGTVVDSATDGDSKQFYTIVTPAGNTFYLIIDLERDSDNVYFLDAVTEKDLLALAEKSGDSSASISATTTSTSSNFTQATTTGTTSQSGTETSVESSSTPQSNNMGTLLLVLAVVAIGGGVGYYFKIYRPKHQQADSEDDADYGDENDLERAEDTQQADDLPPWEDEDDEDGET